MSACGEIVENEKNATYRVMLSLSLVASVVDLLNPFLLGFHHA